MRKKVNSVIMSTFLIIGIICFPSLGSAYSVKSSHPRIWLDEATLATLKNKVQSNTTQWQEFKNACDYAFNPGVWAVTMYIPDLALAYQVLKDSNPELANKYAEKAVELSMGIINQDKDNDGDIDQDDWLLIYKRDSGYDIRFKGRYLAIAYDWLYDKFTLEQKNTIINFLNGWLDWYAEYGYARNYPWDNYFAGYFITLGLTGYATYGDNPRAQEWIEKARDKFENLVIPTFSKYLKGGDWAGGWNYGPLSVVNLISYIEAVKTATGEDLYSKTTYPKEIIYYKIHALRPDWDTVYDGGGWTGNVRAFTSINDVALLYHIYKDTKAGHYIHFYRSHLKNSWNFPYRYDQWYQFLWYEPDGTEEDYTKKEPLSYIAEGTGTVFTRSDWSENAVWASFHCTYTPKGDRDQGHFEIYYKKKLAVDAAIEARGWVNPTPSPFIIPSN